MADRKPRSHATPEERRAQILEAALRCFGARGYHATTMDDLVRASGLSKGSLYWHFDSKDDVFLALLDRLTEEIFAGWEAVRSHGADPIDALQRQCEVALELLTAERSLLHAWVEFMSHPEARERMAEVYRVSRAKLAVLVEEGIARGDLRELPAVDVAGALIAAVEGLGLMALVDVDFDVKQCQPVLWAVLRGGLER